MTPKLAYIFGHTLKLHTHNNLSCHRDKEYLLVKFDHRECSNIALMKIVVPVYTICSSVGLDVKDGKQRCQTCFVTMHGCLLINLYDYSTH